MLCPTADYAEEYYDDLVYRYYGQVKNNDALVTSFDDLVTSFNDLTIKVDYLKKMFSKGFNCNLSNRS